MRIFLISILMVSFLDIHGQQTVGLFQNDSLANDGYTLLDPMGSYHSYLIDNCGRNVHSWQSDNKGGGSYLVEDGSLFKVSRLTNPFFSGGETGGRVEKLDWDGNLLWLHEFSSEPIMQHHDLEPLPNGNLLVLAWEHYTSGQAIAAGRDPSILDTALWFTKLIELELVPPNSFNVVWEWSLFDHLIQDFDSSKDNFGIVSEEKGKLNVNHTSAYTNPTNPDFMHCNGIAFNPLLNQIALSCRNKDEIYIIDHSTTSQEAASGIGGTYGKGGDFLYRWGNPAVYDIGDSTDQTLFGQHDIQWIDNHDESNGNLICFNNYGAGPNQSSVTEWNPVTESPGHYTDIPNQLFGPVAPEWTYTDSELFSGQITGVQRLPNGHTLILQGNSGHFTEVDSNGDVYWEYINPDGFFGMTEQEVEPQFNSVFKARRYPVDYPAFEGLDLIPDTLLELNPYPFDCVIYPQTMDTINGITSHSKQFYVSSLVTDKISVRSDLQLVSWQLVDIYGRMVRSGEGEEWFNINIDGLRLGTYILTLIGDTDRIRESYKILRVN